MLAPVLGDGRPRTQPHAFVALDVLEQPQQSSNPAGAADDAAVQADAHHARSPGGSEPVEPVEGITAVAEELLAGAEVAAALQTAVVIVEAVRDHQVRLTGDLGPV